MNSNIINLMKKQEESLSKFEKKHTDEDIENELKKVAETLNGKTFKDYCEFEDAAAEAWKDCPAITGLLDCIFVSRTVISGQLRNRIRELAVINFENT